MPIRLWFAVLVLLAAPCFVLAAEKSESLLPSRQRLTSASLDELVADELPEDLKFALIDDEQFLRRASLDLIGRQPTPDELSAFLSAENQQTPVVKRRAKAIDDLLANPEFGRNWANYWSDTISYRVPPPELHFLSYKPLKTWLADELNANTSWDKVVRELLTASGKVKEKPAATFVAYHQGRAPKLAAETARIFMGVQIQCAECHDHPFEDWKRHQFHELAAFFARAKGDLGKTLKTSDGTDAVVSDQGKGEHYMPDAEDPKKKGTAMAPVFLSGPALSMDKNDAERRAMLADAVTAVDNPWFARAYVNRTWSRLMGHGFFEPVDDMGGAENALLPQVHKALAESLAASGFDIKEHFRLLANTRIYQRQLPKKKMSDEQPFAAAKTGKLRGDEVFDSLVTAISLPNVTPPEVKPTAAIRFPPPPKSTRDIVAEAFGFDPSLPQEEVFRTMGQAMLLMNNEQLQAQINAKPDSDTMLAKLLADEPNDRAVIDRLFQLLLARRPSEREVKIALGHVKEVGQRGDAFEDVLWGLINSAEFTVRK